MKRSICILGIICFLSTLFLNVAAFASSLTVVYGGEVPSDCLSVDDAVEQGLYEYRLIDASVSNGDRTGVILVKKELLTNTESGTDSVKYSQTLFDCDGLVKQRTKTVSADETVNECEWTEWSIVYYTSTEINSMLSDYYSKEEFSSVIASLSDSYGYSRDEIDKKLDQFFFSENQTEFDGQLQTFSVNSNICSKRGFGKNYNAEYLHNADRVDIYIPLAAQFNNQNIQVTLFIAEKVEKSIINKYKDNTVITVNSAGYYSLDLSDVQLPETGSFIIGFFAPLNTNCFNYVSVSTSAQSGNKYLYDTNLQTVSSDWYLFENTLNTVICKFYYSEKSFPKKDLQQLINLSTIETDKSLRVCGISDIHFNYNDTLAMGTDESRFQLLVDSINAEHHKKPIDFCFFNGDLVTITQSEIPNKFEILKRLVDKYLSQLEMPWFAIRGNHDCFSDEQWEEVFNQKPQVSIETDAFVFLLIDNYSDYENGQLYNGADLAYIGTAKQMPWIKEQVEYAKRANKKVFTAFHSLKVDNEADFLEYFQNEDAIIGQIVGHSHIAYQQSAYGKVRIGTGNFGSLPRNNDGTIDKSNGFGYKMIEIKDNQLISYHIYPYIVYPNWEGSEYIQSYHTSSIYPIANIEKNGGADYNLTNMSNTAVLVDKINELEKRLSNIELAPASVVTPNVTIENFDFTNSLFSVSVKCENVPTPSDVLCGIYDEGRLVAVARNTLNETGSAIALSSDFIPENKIYTLKIFIFENMNSIKPVFYPIVDRIIDNRQLSTASEE